MAQVRSSEFDQRKPARRQPWSQAHFTPVVELTFRLAQKRLPFGGDG